MAFFQFATSDYLHYLVSHRQGETKLGEKVQTITDWDELHNATARYVLLGIPEDIGIRANLGTGGAETAWAGALRSILNIQSTDHFSGAELIIAGAFDLGDWMELANHHHPEGLRNLTAQIDELVAPVIEKIVKAGKLPIIIGGGHNNAYPILKGCSDAKGISINAINLDAHSDYRIAEGRHSGNGFRYAKINGYLDKYAIIGLHENYNSNHIVKELTTDKDIYCSFYEDVFLHEKISFAGTIAAGIQHVSSKPYGIELDLDCIERVLSSAATPSGITTLQARKYVYLAAQHPDGCYLHLAEGATQLSDGRQDVQTAKLIAYLVTDFIKANKQ